MFAAFFGVQAIALAGGQLARNRTVAIALALSAALYGLAYIVVALRSVYGGTIPRAVAHTTIVLFFYWLATMVVAAAIVVPVVFWK